MNELWCFSELYVIYFYISEKNTPHDLTFEVCHSWIFIARQIYFLNASDSLIQGESAYSIKRVNNSTWLHMYRHRGMCVIVSQQMSSFLLFVFYYQYFGNRLLSFLNCKLVQLTLSVCRNEATDNLEDSKFHFQTKHEQFNF